MTNDPGPCMAMLNGHPGPSYTCDLRHGHAGGHESKGVGVSWTDEPCCAGCKTTVRPRETLTFCADCRSRLAELFYPQREVGCAHPLRDWDLVCRACHPARPPGWDVYVDVALEARVFHARFADGYAADAYAKSRNRDADGWRMIVVPPAPTHAAKPSAPCDVFSERRRRERTEWPRTEEDGQAE